MYEVPQTYAMLEHLTVFMQDRPLPQETINNLYELPNIETAVRYLHVAAYFPTKRTWIKTIRKGNYLSWPLINVKNVNKFFLKSEKHKKDIRGANARACNPPKLPLVPDTVETKENSAVSNND